MSDKGDAFYLGDLAQSVFFSEYVVSCLQILKGLWSKDLLNDLDNICFLLQSVYFFSTNTESLESDGTTTNLGPGRLQIKQYAWLFTVDEIGK